MSARRVLFVTGRDPTSGKGGLSAYVRAHARAARAAGREAHIFCAAPAAQIVATDFGWVHRVRSPFAPRDTRSPAAPGLWREWLLANAHTAYAVRLHGPWLAAGLAEFLGAHPAGRGVSEIVHGFYTWGDVGLALARRRRLIVVNSFFTSASHETRAKALAAGSGPGGVAARLASFAERAWIETQVVPVERRVWRRADAALGNYESVRRILEARHGPPGRWVGLPYAADFSFDDDRPHPTIADENSVSSTPVRILSVSRHDPRKGLDILIRALARLRDQGVEFRADLLSGGPLLSAHRAQVQALGLADLVALPGWVDDPRPWLRQADVFVLPSLEEGGGSIAVLEAMQYGRAIVASDIDGLREDLDPGKAACLVPAGDPEALAATLGRLLGDVGERRRLGQAARRRFERDFTADAFARRLGEFYDEIAG